MQCENSNIGSQRQDKEQMLREFVSVPLSLTSSVTFVWLDEPQIIH